MKGPVKFRGDLGLEAEGQKEPGNDNTPDLHKEII
jgi:hypothetical protein